MSQTGKHAGKHAMPKAEIHTGRHWLPVKPPPPIHRRSLVYTSAFVLVAGIAVLGAALDANRKNGVEHPITTTPTTHHPSAHAGALPTAFPTSIFAGSINVAKSVTPEPSSSQHSSSGQHSSPKPHGSSSSLVVIPSNAPVIYTVQKGDNLSSIAKWFHARGYQPVFSWNRSIIGRDPNLIRPGQMLVVVPGQEMTTFGPTPSSHQQSRPAN